MKKIILTGVSCSGKSALLEIFKQKGYFVLPEVALYLIEQEEKKGGNIFPWTAFEEFNKRVIRLQQTWEANIPKNVDVVILDRSLVDAIAYLQDRNIAVPKKVLAQVQHLHYNKAFFLEMLPESYWEKTHSGKPRKQTYERAKQVIPMLKKTYKTLGIQLIDVPVMHPTEKRAEFIEKQF